MGLVVHDLYGGEVQISFDSEPHVYKRIKPGPETVLAGATSKTGILDKPGLRRWYLMQGVDSFKKILPVGGFLTEDLQRDIVTGFMGNGEKTRNKAGDIGTEIHDHISALIKSRIGFHSPLPPSDNVTVRRCVDAWMKWDLENQIEWEESERLVYSKAYETTGTLDQVGRIPGTGTRRLFDVKSSKDIFDEYWLQIGGYWGMYNEEMVFLGRQEVDEAQIIRLDKETGLVEPTVAIDRELLEELWYHFLKCHELYLWQKTWSKKLRAFTKGVKESGKAIVPA